MNRRKAKKAVKEKIFGIIDFYLMQESTKEDFPQEVEQLITIYNDTIQAYAKAGKNPDGKVRKQQFREAGKKLDEAVQTIVTHKKKGRK